MNPMTTTEETPMARKTTTRPSTDELYTKVTAKIVEALETGVANPNGWRAPWHVTGLTGLPSNVARKAAYRGVNVFILWAEQMDQGYDHSLWGTYKQWASAGAQVRRSEKATSVLLWKPVSRTDTDTATGDETKSRYLVAREYKVFNVAQVDGYEMPVDDRDPVETIETADQFFAALGADLHHGGDRAYYTPAADRIQLPQIEAFTSVEGYYATSAHEHTHWTGHKSRCDRDLTERFGSESYAAEELVAELGAAFVCGFLGITTEPRADHAHYIANWLKVLKSDPKAIVTAASKAQQACDWMVDAAGLTAEIDVDDESVAA